MQAARQRLFFSTAAEEVWHWLQNTDKLLPMHRREHSVWPYHGLVRQRYALDHIPLYRGWSDQYTALLGLNCQTSGNSTDSAVGGRFSESSPFPATNFSHACCQAGSTEAPSLPPAGSQTVSTHKPSGYWTAEYQSSMWALFHSIVLTHAHTAQRHSQHSISCSLRLIFSFFASTVFLVP